MKDPTPPAGLAAFELCSEDLLRVEEILAQGVRSNLDLPETLSQYLVQSGGKRIRPLLLCLSRSCLSQPGLVPRAEPFQVHTLAAVAEWVHTSTLFHDDVLDASPERRGQPSAQILHGNKVAILVGDFIYAEAFARLMDCGLMEASKTLAHTIKRLVEGELLQHRICQERSTRLEDYDRVAHAKTASLFGWCTGTGAWAAGCTNVDQAQRFGEALGYAFQMADDLLDTFELSPHDATAETLEEWIVSSPPLPVLLAVEEHERAQNLWTRLHPSTPLLEQRSQVAELQRLCLNERVIHRCQARIAQALNVAEDALQHLSAAESPLGESILWIRARAEQGFAAAQGREETVRV